MPTLLEFAPEMSKSFFDHPAQPTLGLSPPPYPLQTPRPRPEEARLPLSTREYAALLDQTSGDTRGVPRGDTLHCISLITMNLYSKTHTIYYKL